MLATALVSNRPLMWGNVISYMHVQSRQPDIFVASVPQDQVADMTLLVDSMGYERWSVVAQNPEYNYGGFINQGFDAACEELEGRGIIALLNDDDWYDTDYLREVEDCFAAHPDAGMIGKSEYWYHYPGGEKPDTYHKAWFEIRPEWRVYWIAGPTLSVRAETWKAYPGMRATNTDIWGDASLLANVNGLDIHIYHSSDKNYRQQRYGAEHKHIWNPEGLKV